MKVSDILAKKGRNVFTTSAEQNVADAVALLSQHNVGALVVVEETYRLAGIISERDIVRALATSGAGLLDQPLSTIMTHAVVTCSENDSIDDVMAEMTDGRFRHLPVVAGGRLEGIVSIGDIVKARISEVEREAEEMRSYILMA